MEELVNKVVELRAAQEHEMASADNASMLADKAIAYAEDELTVLKSNRKYERQPYVELAQEIQTTVDSILETILNKWDGKKKTNIYQAGTIVFRGTGSLKIIDEIRLMNLLIEKTCTLDVVRKYIKGFKLTEVRKFVDVFNVPTGVAVMEYKTTVSVKPSEDKA